AGPAHRLRPGRRHRRRARVPGRDERALPRHRPGAGPDPPDRTAGGRGGRARLPGPPAQGPPLGARRGRPDRPDPRGRRRQHRDPARPQAHHRPAAGAQSQLPLHPLRLRCPHPPLAVPELQGVGHGQAAAELRRGMSTPAVLWTSLALAAVSALGTWLTLRYARRRLLDLPGERRSHTVPTPRGGGLGITIALLAGTALAVAGGVLAPLPALAFAAGLLLVAGIGWIDDHRPLSPWSRLAVQCLAGLVLAAGLYAGQGDWRWALLACAAVPVLVNVWNFMDGID